MKTDNNKYTPETIANSKILFSIPLYQRLFEWEKEQITQLLKDLYSGFHKPDKPYHIGMLTVHNNYLVDGQQRFTVLMLMAIAFNSENNNWNNFLKVDEKIRLSFFAREKDKNYLLAKIKGENPTEYKNAKMEVGIKCITDFVGKLENRDGFINYVFQQLTFFISELPESYQSQDLNKYFESMNADGRGLENHEILKVELLKNVSVEKQSLYTRIWNAVSDMDKPLIRSRYINKVQENKDELNKRQSLAIENISDLRKSFEQCNASTQSIENRPDIKSIKDISSSSVPPKESYRSIGDRAILSFSEFLLHVLWLHLLDKNEEVSFNEHKLQETFVCLKRDTENVEKFFENLLKYRILFDYFIIRISSKDDNTTTYTLAFKEDESETEIFKREKLIKYQSMLYVSTASSIWLTKALSILASNPIGVSIDSFYQELVKFDNDRHSNIVNLSLKYGEIDRYWFWRLDFYLWCDEIKKSKENQDKSIIEYSFKANRSIEHLHAQAAMNKWSELEEAELLNSFGNLAMISPSFNSTQSNDVENVKFARVENQINGKNLLESIKMLLMYRKAKNSKWTPEFAIEHGNEMIEILINSFSDVEHNEIKNKLNEQKIKITQQ